jgi:hypothetical protein
MSIGRDEGYEQRFNEFRREVERDRLIRQARADRLGRPNLLARVLAWLQRQLARRFGRRHAL